MQSATLARQLWTGTLTALLVATSADLTPAVSAPPEVPKGSTPSIPGPKPRAVAKLPEKVLSEEYEDVDGAPRPTEAPAAVRARQAPVAWTAATIDAIVDRQLAVAKTGPAPQTGDEAFSRRVTLDLIGKPPTIREIRQFGASRAVDKRAALVDSLLENPEFGENWARYWRDVIAFRSPNENERTVDYPQFVTWLADQFNENVPWNKIASAVITATGRTDENGAAVFAIAEEADPVELAGEVSRVFLGIQIQCAQCHDHPSDPWKRQQFHEFAAFFSGVRRRQVEKAAMGQKAVYQVNVNGPTRYAMTDLKDPEKKIPITPRFFLGESPQVSNQVSTEGRLALAAGYVTDPANPWFARAFVNRVWTTLVGEGFYDLVDDLGPTRIATSNEIIDGLSEQFRAHNHDVRWLFATIMKTRVYARESRSTNSAAGRIPFAANIPSRLRADQIYDALSQSLNIEQTVTSRPMLQAVTGGGQGKGKAKGTAKTAKAAGGEIDPEEALRKVVEHAFGVDPSSPADTVVGTIPQALYLMNSPLVSRSVQARPGTMLGMLLASAGSPKEAVETLYLKTLARRPNPKELSTCLRYLDNTPGREGFEDILWSLVNSTEFISRR